MKEGKGGITSIRNRNHEVIYGALRGQPWRLEPLILYFSFLFRFQRVFRAVRGKIDCKRILKGTEWERQ